MPASVRTKVKPNNSGTTQLFKNPVLERLTRAHYSVTLGILCSIAAFLLYWSGMEIGFSITQIAGLFTVGYFSWTLAEYLLHRFVFHMAPTNKIKNAIQHTLHGVHHEYPKDKSRVVMPPTGALIIGSVLFVIFWIPMQQYAFAFVPGFLLGYVTYAFMHYAIHAYQPPKNFLKVLWINHGIHHYKDDDRGFGVSSPFWDFVFGTLPKK
ncbi:sterol desaturase family protein [uncultured Imperialibacter sp.]|uniref:sterol desaturase family protein n=1 Tax=uncultured Imperialibacter sp. TaxID=1672639 RepID=UPI0030DBB76D|tara:strand:+ start:37206 stop:37832 length:627 start_codon:yes stop_codon:yes gene_type:complete